MSSTTWVKDSASRLYWISRISERDGMRLFTDLLMMNTP